MVGSVLSGILLVRITHILIFLSILNPTKILGGCFIAGGYKERYMKFNKDVTQLMSSLLVVASAYLIVPSVLYSTSIPDNSGTSGDSVQLLSVVTSIILLLFYVLFLTFQLYSHQELFKGEEEPFEGEDDPHKLGITSASIFLLLTSIGVNFCSDYLIDSIDGVVELLHISRAFIGLIIVPIVGNAGELATTISAASRGNLDMAIGVIVGSTLQIALFVTPVMVVAGWFMDQYMTLKFDPFETTVLSLSVIVVNYLIQDGRTNYFAGALLVGT
jgi:calcium/proton exchanger